MHSGNRVNSRAEGVHSSLKKYLQVSTGDLREVKDKICLAIDTQFHEIKARFSSEKIRLPHRFRISFFKNLVTRVSIIALDALNKQYELAQGNDLSPLCKDQFLKSMGLPCAHMIRERQIDILELNSIHEQWGIDTRSLSSGDESLLHDEVHIDDLLAKFKDKYQQMSLVQKEETQNQLTQFISTPLPFILEPNIIPHKGRHLESKKKKGDNSTRRDPSAFEIVENARKCTTCRVVRHNRTTCPLTRSNPLSMVQAELGGATIVDMIDFNAPLDDSIQASHT